MGLDMYFLKEHKDIEFMEKELNGNEILNYDLGFSIMGSLRKANQIHNWLVKNIQEGDDHCGYYILEKNKIVELKNIVKKVLDNSKLVKGIVNTGYTYTKVYGVMEKVCNTKQGEVIENIEVAKNLLPSTSGFFFGSTDYDQWYIQDLKKTEKILKEILKTTDFDKEVIIYHSSW